MLLLGPIGRKDQIPELDHRRTLEPVLQDDQVREIDWTLTLSMSLSRLTVPLLILASWKDLKIPQHPTPFRTTGDPDILAVYHGAEGHA